MSECRSPVLERLDYAEGSHLLARDLRDAMAYEARLLALHVRGPHETWGVTSGLRLQLSANRRIVVVSPGAAFACGGAVVPTKTDVVLAAPTTVVPGVNEPVFDVILSRRGVRWEPTGRAVGSRALGAGVHLGDDIPLGRFVRLSGGTLQGPDYSVRRSAHPQTRPHIATGIGQTLSWLVGPHYLHTSVSTAAGHFTGTPYYATRVSGLPNLANLDVIGPFVSLAFCYWSSFSIRLSFATTRAGETAPQALERVRPYAAGIEVFWIGVESIAGCSTEAPGGQP